MSPKRSSPKPVGRAAAPVGRPSALLDTRIIYCGDCLDQLKKLPDGCVDLIYIDPPFNSNRNYEVFWGETREKRAFADRHAIRLQRDPARYSIEGSGGSLCWRFESIYLICVS